MGSLMDQARGTENIGSSQIPDLGHFKQTNEMVERIRKRQEEEVKKYSLSEKEYKSIHDVLDIPGGKALLRFVKLQLRLTLRSLYATNPEKVAEIAGLQGKAHTYNELIELMEMEVEES